jgi:hypothetical protein
MIMQGDKTPPTPDKELPPIEGELTDEDLKEVSGGCGRPVNETMPAAQSTPSWYHQHKP